MKSFCIAVLMLCCVAVLPTAAHGEHPTEGKTYQLRLTTNPETVEAGQPFTLTLQIFQPDRKTPVADFAEVHTKLLHLIIVSEDLTQFLHVHPDYQGKGVFVLEELVLPEKANYVLFADFTPTDGDQQAVRGTLATKDTPMAMPNLKVSDTEAVVDGLRFQLELPKVVSAGVEQSIKFQVTDAETGNSIDDLDEYLGAGGHLVVLNDTAEIYIHSHPAGHEMGSMVGMSMNTQYGPDLEFNAEFPDTGLYAMWLQVQYKGEIYTAPFVIEVTGIADDTSESTPEATMEGMSG